MRERRRTAEQKVRLPFGKRFSLADIHLQEPFLCRADANVRKPCFSTGVVHGTNQPAVSKLDTSGSHHAGKRRGATAPSREAARLPCITKAHHSGARA